MRDTTRQRKKGGMEMNKERKGKRYREKDRYKEIQRLILRGKDCNKNKVDFV